MGWERKRGKLLEFNRLLRGARDTSYVVLSADPAGLPSVRYVITLDADTQVPRDAIRRLVGAMSHPLNRPRFDPVAGRVVAGFGVLQPRISFHLAAATHSRFAALLAASGGIDPYSTATSDVFMDLFGVGSFTGKGIYDVDSFDAATADTFPENHILSHDLIEGNYARCGLLNDTELFDDFPARYHAYARREERWVRGDWQLLPWLGPRVPTCKGWRANPLPALERWKLLDNLRRSLVPPALVLLLLLGWTTLPGSPWIWTVVALIVMAVPFLQTILTGLSHSARRRSLTGLKVTGSHLGAVAGEVLLGVTFLAYRAVLLLDAILRTLTRLCVTRRKLLDWETALSTEYRLKDGMRHFFVRMWAGPALAVVSALAIMAFRASAAPAAFLFLLAWLVSPAVACWISRPSRPTEIPLDEDERRALRRLARKTWHFFETFVGDQDHWLPPDNFQEVPDGRVAHRTSPTNSGLLLLSTLAAHDMGYISVIALVDRLERTLATLERLEKHWGHLYNWYDTRSLEPLSPRYLSTVDSGNLLGCLFAVKKGLLEKIDEPVPAPAAIAGLADTISLLREECGDDCLPIAASLENTPRDLRQWKGWLERLRQAAIELERRSDAAVKSSGKTRQKPIWLNRLLEQIDSRLEELRQIAPWIEELSGCDGFSEGALQISPSGPDDRATLTPERLLAPIGLGQLDAHRARWAGELDQRTNGETGHSFHGIAEGLRASSAAQLAERMRRLVERIEEFCAAMDFRPLYRPERHLFSIGIDPARGRLDAACYDLLASEACLTSFLAVARGQAPRRHWFQLGRHFIRAAGRL
jgi:cyclic beta-1,2-glucan synthetase